MDFEIEGSEEFVRSEMRQFLPHLAGGAPPKENPAPSSSLKQWFDTSVPRGRIPTMQDTILIFGYYMKRAGEKHMFSPGDVKACFGEIGRDVPKSLLQIMGTLKRDHGLLWSPEDRRGVYALSPDGIKRVEGILGVGKGRDRKQPAADPSKAPVLREEARGGPRSTSEKWDLLFKHSASDGQ
jgi:hypothetical protein